MTKNSSPTKRPTPHRGKKTMAGRLMRFCYCAECETVVEESVNMVRWFEYDFCAIKCLNKFVRKNIGNCTECHTKITIQSIHAIKSVSPTATFARLVHEAGPSTSTQPPSLVVSNASQFTAKYFCSAPCLNAFTLKTNLCDFCRTQLPGNKGQANNEAGQQTATFCSATCRMLMQVCSTFNQLFVGKCVQCGEKGNITQRCLLNDTEYLICSPKCLFDFEVVKDVNLGKCLEDVQWLP